MSYSNCKSARQHGPNRTTQAEISTHFWLKNAGRVKAPFYHFKDGSESWGSFLNESNGPLEKNPLGQAELERKKARLNCFKSQSDILKKVSQGEERYRIAPPYSFTAPPHEGQLLYESWGLWLTGERFRELARVALSDVQLDA